MGSERLSHLPKVTQLVRGAGRVRPRALLRSELEHTSSNRYNFWCHCGSDSVGSFSLVLAGLLLVPEDSATHRRPPEPWADGPTLRDPLGMGMVVEPWFTASGRSPSHGFSSCRAWALSYPWACGILVPRPGIEPESPELPGRFLTTGPPGQPIKDPLTLM